MWLAAAEKLGDDAAGSVAECRDAWKLWRGRPRNRTQPESKQAASEWWAKSKV